ncbi:hypothetical protein HKCCE2091_16350 [Rhodobacterales bacterium HKCCE2091]|nr:hypothetical protein [Rhodobacterales bacterium HKCCE2091]
MSADLFTSFPLRRTRVHEVSGPSAAGFAAMAGAGTETVFWIRESWRPEVLNPVGLSEFLDPARLLVAEVSDQTEGLAVMEEALRDGSVPFVVIETSQPLGLTPGRRLQLAAKAGQSVGLCLIPEGMGSNAAETRWHCSPVFDRAAAASDSTLQRWDLTKNKSGTLGTWHVRWDRTSRRVRVVSPARE